MAGEVRDVDGRDSLNDAEAVSDLRQVPVMTIGITPASRIVTITEPRSPGADRFRYLRMRLRDLKSKARLQSLVVTSPLPQDGKSTVAMNLATVLAEGGARSVLLVEADLHHPTLTHSLKLSARPGLAECLEQGRDPMSALLRLEPLAWYLLPAGKAAGNPTELLQSQAFPAAMESLSSYFDWVIFDTPPIAPLTDALAVSRHADATLLVVRAHQTPCDVVEEALTLLGPGKVAGIVFNGAEHLNRLYYKYGHYYGRK